jgi:hypothetical protein
MVIDNQVTLTGSMNWTGGAAQNSENLNLVASKTIAAAYAGHWHQRLALSSSYTQREDWCRRPEMADFKSEIAAEMRPEQDDWLDMGSAPSQPRNYSAESLRPPEIVGEVTNPVLETVRRFWWRAFDRVCGCIVFIRLSIHDRKNRD